MLHILWVILKFIGIALVVVLLLILAVILAALFVPVRYRVNGKRTPDEMWGSAKLSWLLHLITIKAEYKNGDINAILQILFFKRAIYPFPEKSSKGKKRPQKDKKEDMRRMEIPKPDVSIMSIPEEAKEPPNDEIEESRDEAGAETKTKTIWQKIKDLPKTIRSFFRRLQKLLKRLLRLRENVFEKFELIRSEETKEVYRRFKGHLLYLWKHTQPRKMKGVLRFGFDDPSLTGLAAGGIYLLMPSAFDEVMLYPDFEQVIFEGELLIKGRIRIYHLVRIGWLAYRDKEFRMLLKTMKI